MPEERSGGEKPSEELSQEEKIQKLRTGELIVEKTLEENTRLRKELGLPPAAGGDGGRGPMTLEAFGKLSPAERTQFYRDNPEQYSKFMDAIRTKGERDLFSKGAPAL